MKLNKGFVNINLTIHKVKKNKISVLIQVLKMKNIIVLYLKLKLYIILNLKK